MTEDMERTRNEILAQVLLDPAVACATVVALGARRRSGRRSARRSAHSPTRFTPVCCPTAAA